MLKFFGAYTIFSACFICYAAIAAENELLTELDGARRLWETANLKKYSYTLKNGGPFGYTLYKISINNGRCKAKSRYIMGRATGRWTKTTCEGNTIAEIHDELRSQLTRGVADIRMELDPVLGYTKYFYLEPKTDLPEQSWYVEISNFKRNK